MSVIYKKLEEVCEILDSRRIPITAKDRKSGMYPYYGANGLQDYVAEYIFDDELVLLAEDGGNFGSKDRPIAYRVSGKCWVNNHAHVLKAKPCIDIDYLCYALMFYDTDGLVNGATRQKLTQAAMRQMVIPYRDMTDQLRIVNEISQVEGLIEKRKEEMILLDQLVKSRFIELFGDPVINPLGWPKRSLGTVCDVRDGTHDSPEYYETGYPLVTSKNVTGGHIDLTTCSFISEDAYNQINARSKVDKGDIIMPMIGTVGNPVIVDVEPTFAIKNVALIKFPTQSLVKNIYIRALLQSDYFDRAVISKVRGGTQKFIALGDIRRLEILIPDSDTQEQFSAFVEQTDKSKLAVQQGLQELEILKKSLMQQYFG